MKKLLWPFRPKQLPRLLLFFSAFALTAGAVEPTTESDNYYNNLQGSLPTYNEVGPGYTRWAKAPPQNQCSYGPGKSQFDHEKILDFIGQAKNKWDGISEKRAVKWLLSAHRGVYGKLYPNAPAIPENSLQAIIETGARNFELIELDIHEDNAGELVLAHDYATGRMMINNQQSNRWSPLIDPPVYTSIEDSNMTVGGVLVVNEVGGGGVIDNVNSTYYPAANHEKITFSSPSGKDVINVYNPSLKAISNWSSYELRGFDRDSHQFETNTDARQNVLKLYEALSFIGNNYPGMVVVLDLRHKDEIIKAVQVVDSVTNCKGISAKDWVIFKPFANAIPDGLTYVPSSNTTNYTLSEYVPNWNNYYWIPVLSSRLLNGATKGPKSVHPAGGGPDINTINTSNEYYIDNWLGNTQQRTGSKRRAVIGFEVADKNGLPELAYEYNSGLAVTSWRPPDVRQDNEFFSTYNINDCNVDDGSCVIVSKTCSIILKDRKARPNIKGRLEALKCATTEELGDTNDVIGYNWKDDGLGRYPVSLENYNCLQNIQKAQIITVDDADRVMYAFRGETRDLYLANSPDQERKIRNYLYTLTNDIHPAIMNLIIE